MVQRAALDTSRAMFELAPVSLWLEDYRDLKLLFASWREAGITDLRAFFHDEPHRVRECARQIRILEVNHKTHELFESRDLDHLIANLGTVFRDDMLDTHGEEMIQLWEGDRRAHV